MNHRSLLVSVALVGTLLLVSALAPIGVAKAPAVPVLIGLKPGSGDPAALLRPYGGTVTWASTVIDVVAALVPSDQVNRLSSSGKVSFVEEDQERQLLTHTVEGVWTPDLKTYQVLPWGVDADTIYSGTGVNYGVRASAAWTWSRGAGVRVAVLDTGMDLDHKDLRGAYLGGYDFVDDDSRPDDDQPGVYQGHGTHTAGTIAARDNTFGVAGVAPSVGLYILRICDSRTIEEGGGCADSDVLAAVEWAVRGPDGNVGTSDDANVISMSIGGPHPGVAERMMMDWAYDQGVLLVASSGNEAAARPSYPAAYKSVISVGATDVNGWLAPFSSYGGDLELVAPGVDVLSTYPLKLGRETMLTDSDGYVYQSNPMDFGALTGKSGITGQVVYAGLATLTDPDYIAADLEGKIALIKRGEITFAAKIDNVVAKGAIGAIIFNRLPGNFFGTLGSPKPIPAVSISLAEGLAFKTKVDAGYVAATLFVQAADYEVSSGTSMSAPHASGVAALVWGANPDLTNAEVRTILRATATDLGPAGTDIYFGYGLVDAEAAVAAAMAWP